MKFCTKCGKSIDDQAAFCPYCGTACQAQMPHNNAIHRLHCPRCKGRNLSAMTESVGSVGSATAIGRRSAIGGSTILRQRSWMCSDCGNVFRNVDDWEADIKNRAKIAIVLLAVCDVSLLLFAILLAAISGNFKPLVGIIFATVITFAGIVYLVKFLTKTQLKKVDELRRACFD